MRWLTGAIVVLVTSLATTGCKNSSTGQYSNPFLTPDRVPPPSTRVLAPGTAQPYYPGDPMPGTAPGVGTPTFGPPPTSPPMTTPPGGWGSYSPQSSSDASGTTLAGEAVGVPGDNSQLRFAVADPVGPQQLASQEISQAEYLAGASAPFIGGVSPAAASSTSDGFRPQGSQTLPVSESDQSFRPPAIRREGTTASTDDSAQYAAATNHEWLRGQLEYWPVSGEWSLRYLPEGGPADAMGGRVMIDNPQVLANLQPGELVAVEGQLFARAAGDGAPTPTYRVAAVQRQRQ